MGGEKDGGSVGGEVVAEVGKEIGSIFCRDRNSEDV